MGRIGKPQKSNRHRKTKIADPGNEGVRISKKGAHKINSRPLDPDQQEIPRSMKEIMGLQDDVKTKTKKKRNKNKFKSVDHGFTVEKGMSRPLKPVPDFTQKKNECEEAFLNRVEKQTQVVIATSQFEDKFGVEVGGVEKDGHINMVKTKKMSEKKKERLIKKKEKKKQKKIQKTNERDFSSLQDEVYFGERVDAPPTITAKPRKSKDSDSLFRPGKKDLLLKEIAQGNTAQSGSSGGAKDREIGKTIKRKQLSLSQQRRTDAERERAIDLYRQMKAKKMKPLT